MSLNFRTKPTVLSETQTAIKTTRISKAIDPVISISNSTIRETTLFRKRGLPAVTSVLELGPSTRARRKKQRKSWRKRLIENRRSEAREEQNRVNITTNKPITAQRCASSCYNSDRQGRVPHCYYQSR